MSPPLILDTGPLTAFLNKKDAHHPWALKQFQAVKSPVVTCESVISEACFLLNRTPTGSDAVWTMMQRGFLRLDFNLETEQDAIQKLIQAYRDVPMSVADACLVRMAELMPQAMILTLDSDFQIYRKHRYEAIPCLAPWNT